MVKYTVHNMTPGRFEHTLEVRRDGVQIASIEALHNVVTGISGKPDKGFVKEYGHSPAIELILHLAQIVGKNQRLYGWSVRPAAVATLRRMEKLRLASIERSGDRHFYIATSRKPKLPLTKVTKND